jgi:hypothetical protein
MNPRAAAVKIAYPTSNEACTVIGAQQFGRIWRKMSLEVLAPSDLAASMNVSSFKESAWPLTKRVYQGHQVIDIAAIAFVIEGPNAAAMNRASRRDGNERNMSVILIIASSTFPPRNPATNPKGTPMLIAILTTTIPISIEIRVPLSTLLKISLPISSVPNRCSKLGGWSMCPKFEASQTASWPGSKEASETITMPMTIVKPRAERGFLAIVRTANLNSLSFGESLIFHAFIS